MATTNGDRPDPLLLLRKSVISKNTPTLSTFEDPSSAPDLNSSLAQASYLVFNFDDAQDGSQHIAVPLTQITRLIIATAKDGCDLRSVFFAWQKKDLGTVDYINAITAINAELKSLGKEETVTNLSFQERTDLAAWLVGDLPEGGSEFIRSIDDNKATRRQADAAAAAAAGDGDVDMQDVAATDAAARKREELLRLIYASERKMGDRNTVLRGSKVQDFSGVKKYSALFMGKREPKQQQATTPALSSNPALRPPIKPSQPGRRPEPIILLSPSASSLLRLPNIKSFLVDGVYTPADSVTSSGANILQLTRKLNSISSHPMRFILVDGPENFRHDYWDRVVAVFTTGQTWQFKNYKWQDPATLFTHALGVYVGWKGEVVPDTVKGWGRGVLTVQIDKGPERWRDREVVEDIWSAIEARMKVQGWAAGR